MVRRGAGLGVAMAVLLAAVTASARDAGAPDTTQSLRGGGQAQRANEGEPCTHPHSAAMVAVGAVIGIVGVALIVPGVPIALSQGDEDGGMDINDPAPILVAAAGAASLAVGVGLALWGRRRVPCEPREPSAVPAIVPTAGGAALRWSF